MRNGMDEVMRTLMPIAERIMQTQEHLNCAKAELVSRDPRSLTRALAEAEAEAEQRRKTEKAEENKDQQEGEKQTENAEEDTVEEDVEEKQDGGIRTVVPFSSLPAPSSLSPQIPSLLQQLHSSLHTLLATLRTLPATFLSASFDILYLPLFTILFSHPKAEEQQTTAAARQQLGSNSKPSTATPNSTPFPMLPHQDRVWEVTLQCLQVLLDAAIREPMFVRATLCKRFFGIFQLLLHFLPSDFKTSTNAAEEDKQRTTMVMGATRTDNSAASRAVWHSEETRMTGIECVTKLISAVQVQLQTDIAIPSPSSSSQIPSVQPLLSTLQLNPAFAISLGYHIHLLVRFISKERNRELRRKSMEGVEAIIRLLQLPILNQPSSSASSSMTFAPVPGRLLLLSYFPGIMSALFNLLVFDSQAAVRSGGWKLQRHAMQLFMEVTRIALTEVANVDEVVQEVVSGPSKSSDMADDDDDDALIKPPDAHTETADRAMQKLQSLLPKPQPLSSSTHSRRASSAAMLTQLHPVLRNVMRPLDASWWHETRSQLVRMMDRIFSATQLTTRTEIASIMLTAATTFLCEQPDDTADFHPALTANGNTLYTSLLPPQCVTTWLEFIVFSQQHDDDGVRRQAEKAMEQISSRASGWRAQAAASTALVPQPIHSSPLLPLLSTSLSAHLLRLPRALPSASETQQLALLKTIKASIHALGRCAQPESDFNPLYQFFHADMERMIQILYRVWEVEGKESKVLERERTRDDMTIVPSKQTTAAVAESTSSTALSLPTYFHTSLTHMHTPAAHTLSLSILHDIGYYLSHQFGLFIAYLHERLVNGMHEVQERSNYSSTNKLKETILIINQLMLGAASAVRSQRMAVHDLVPHIEMLFFEYLNPILWHLPLSNPRRTHRDAQTLTHAQLQNNLVIVTLLIRGIGDMAQASQYEFQPFLMHVLHPLLEKLASTHATVHQSALATLHRVAMESGYNVALDGESAAPTGADQDLQNMLVHNMDYLVEQMTVELRNLQPTFMTSAGSSSSSAQVLTLPLVLTSLLTKISFSCTRAIIPLLDDTLDLILDKLSDLTLQQQELAEDDAWSMEMDLESMVAASSVSMSRLAYLEILRSLANALYLIKQHEQADGSHETKDPSAAMYASAPPLPSLMPPGTIDDIDVSARKRLEMEVDSMLNFDGDEEKSEEKSSSNSVEHFCFAPVSIRQRLERNVAAAMERADRQRYEAEWLRRQQLGMTMEDETDGVARDSDGQSRAERWYKEREAERVKQERLKWNAVNGMEDEELDAEMERNEAAHRDAPEIPLTHDQSTALRIFAQCRNYLDTASGHGLQSLAQQSTVLATVSHCIPVLEPVPKHLFPEIAKFWPSLQRTLRLIDNATLDRHSGQNRSHKLEATESNMDTTEYSSTSPMHTLMQVHTNEPKKPGEEQLTQLIASLSSTAVIPAPPSPSTFSHSTSSPLFIHGLSVLSLLVRCASKFLSARFSNELWPLLQHILTFEQGWMKELQQQQKEMNNKSAHTKQQHEANDGRIKLLPAYKVQRALLETLAELARYPDLSSMHVIELSSHVLPYLSRDQPVEFQRLALQLLSSLSQHDADAVWQCAWRLCPHTTMQHTIQISGRNAQSVKLTHLSSFILSHPCFQHRYPNFDPALLLHQRAHGWTDGGSQDERDNPYQESVLQLLHLLSSSKLAQSKLALY